MTNLSVDFKVTDLNMDRLGKLQQELQEKYEQTNNRVSAHYSTEIITKSEVHSRHTQSLKLQGLKVWNMAQVLSYFSAPNEKIFEI